MNAECPFCSPASAHILIRNSLCYACYDGFPVTDGHLLIIPSRHVSNFFELSEQEQEAALGLVRQAKTILDSKFHPHGFNIGVNVGEASGQTVAHVHIHLIPRYLGDVPDPRGGVRWIIPSRARYWAE